MCGIAGLSGEKPVQRASLAAAGDAIAHRGPDDSGLFVSADGRTGFVHRRLSIIDLSPAGHQPMGYRDSGLTITYNGEIYNFRELRAELLAKGYGFSTETDTEVLLAGYSAWGAELLPRLNGIFAFAIHDARDDTIFVAVDHLGIKPLYYHEGAASLSFASELKALLALGPVGGGLDHAALARYMTFLYSPGDQTPLSKVRRFPAGSAMIARRGRVIRRWRYYELPAYSPRRDWSARECADALTDNLRRCVERQMVSDAPLGAFLSGGLDSSAIVAAAIRVDPAIQCFTIRTEGAAEAGVADDLPYARKVAAHLGVKLHEVEISSQRMAENVERMVYMLDEPIADPACLNVYFISQLAADMGVKVLLSGAGGDDIFTGYRRHQLLGLQRMWDRIPSPLGRAAAALAARSEGSNSVMRRGSKMLRTLTAAPESRLFAGYAWRDPAANLELFSRDIREALSEELVYRPMAEAREAVQSMPLVEQSLRLDQLFFLSSHNLIYTDKMSMAAGIEARVPLLDPEMLQFAASVPTEWKQRRLRAKWIFKESQRGILPDEVIDRPKSGFGAPLRRWLRNELAELTGDLLSETVLARRGLFDPAAVERLVRANAAGTADASYTLFSIMCIEIWCRHFLDASVHASEIAAE